MKAHNEKKVAQNDAQVSDYISEGNPNDQKVASDQQSAQMVRQAIKDDQSLSTVARDIHVTVKDGTVTLEGQVSTEQQLNLATNTAGAVAVDEKVKNRMEVTHNK
jgi:osmotically-inducible protein OsmY